MDETIKEILHFVEDNDIKFVRLQFCDIFGRLKNVSIMSNQLERAFKYGISFDASSIDGFLDVEESDLFLVPDPATIAILPWRPQEGRVARFFCYIIKPDGEIFEGDCRNVLKNTVKELQESNYIAKIGAECEFYLFKTDDEAEPLLMPQDNAGYFDVAPFDKGENIRREICLSMEEMGLKPESSHHESGPGQNEIDFKYDNPLESADNLITIKSAIKTIANLNGLYASFMPKPMIGKSGSGLHINVSLVKNEENIFKENNEHFEQCQNFIAGVLYRTKEISAVLNPVVNSYKRFGEWEAPKYITWSKENRFQLIRIPASIGKYSRMELRSPDVTCNPYLAFTLIIKAGLEGIKQKRKLPDAVEGNIEKISKNSNVEELPHSLKEAIEIMQSSQFVRDSLGDFIFEKFISKKKLEWSEYEKKSSSDEEITDWEISNYFYRL